MSLHVRRAMASILIREYHSQIRSNLRTRKTRFVMLSCGGSHSVWGGKAGLRNAGTRAPASNENNADHRTHIPRAGV